MKVKSTPNVEIKQINHVQQAFREYAVTLHDPIPRQYTFRYEEVPVIEYIFDGDFAISGANFHHLYGVIKDNNFYSSDFSKYHSYIKKGKNSPFWDSIGKEFTLTLDNKKRISFESPVNLFFNITLYWHWFNEDLPLVKFFQTNDFPIITNKLADWQKDSLKFFPRILERIVEVETPCIIVSPEFHTFSFPAISYRGKTSKWVPLWLKQHLVPTVKTEPFKKIYISRGDAQARCVENEIEVKEFLCKKGFVCIDNFSSFTIQEKINLFYSAKIVISPTGAGLTHCHAMQENTTVIDFGHSFNIEEEYGWNNTGTAVGIDWHTFAAITGSKSLRSGKGVKKKNDNLIVDLSVLNEVINRVLD